MMSQKQIQWNKKRDVLIAKYGEQKLLKAYRLNQEGLGWIAICGYTAIPLRQVCAAIQAGEDLVSLA